MANFCSSCGAARSGGSAFCSSCGARQATPASSPMQASVVPPPVAQPLPPASSGSGIKILAIVLVFLVFAAAATVGGLYYVAHRV